MSGLAMGVKLRRAGFDGFTIFERSDGPGGTWRDNSYPGCEVDILSHAYSFSFFPYDWSRNFARQPELLRYCEAVVDHFGLRPHCRFGVEVLQAVWDEQEREYELHLSDGRTARFDVVVSALGFLSTPSLPAWPGLDEFDRIKFHSARWEHEHDLRGKRVAVVGVGSTGAQLVPAVAERASRVYVYQRQPGWMLHKDDRDYTPRERARYRRFRPLQRYERHHYFYVRQKPSRLRAVHRAQTKEQAELRWQLETRIRQVVRDPGVAAALTPDFPVGCKRIVFESSFYESFNLEHVELVPHAVVRVTPTGVVDDAGGERQVDALIMCTGFQPTRYLASMNVIGLGGRSLHDAWDGSPSGYMGLTVPGFPNFFMLYGPNTNGGVSIMSLAERQAGAVVAALRSMRRRRRTVVDTRPAALRAFVRCVDRGNARRTAVNPRFCTNYFFAPSGRNVTQWPSTTRVYTAMLVLFRLGLRMR